MKLYVGNLNFKTTTEGLVDLFSNYGEVTDAIVMMDRETGRSRGFGFVTFAAAESGTKAIEALHDQDFEGRKLVVNEAKPKEDRPRTGGFGGGSSGGSRGGFGGGSRGGFGGR